MKFAAIIRILAMPAMLWAIWPPAGYGVVFAYCMHWSAIFDLLIIGCAIVLCLSFWMRMHIAVWFPAWVLVAATGMAGMFTHFRDSGESGPLPFEWINDYIFQALPLVCLTLAFHRLRRS